jgi:hypothetical protein
VIPIAVERNRRRHGDPLDSPALRLRAPSTTSASQKAGTRLLVNASARASVAPKKTLH